MALSNGLTPKQDEFARAYVETRCATEAYRRAGYSTRQSDKSIHENASKLLTKVMPRVEQLQQRAQKRHDVTVDDIRKMLEEDRQFAREVKQAGASVSAAMGIAKLYGHLVDKQEHSGKDGAPSIAVTITRKAQ